MNKSQSSSGLEQVGAVIVYTFVFHMLAPPMKSNELISTTTGQSVAVRIHPSSGSTDTIPLSTSCIGTDANVTAPLLLTQSQHPIPKVWHKCLSVSLEAYHVVAQWDSSSELWTWRALELFIGSPA